jgi:23S rRNA (guanosine2251-2'-O)-methyltransferase
MSQQRPPRAKPARPGEKSQSPRGEKPSSPRGEKSYTPRGDKPQAARGGEKPQSARSGEKPYAARDGKPQSPRGDKPFAARGDKAQSFGNKKFDGPRKFDGPKLSLSGRSAKPERPHDRPPMTDRQPRGQHRTPAVPNGAVWLYGTHAVAAALANPARRLRRLVITQDSQASLAAERPLPWPIQPEVADREKIDQLLGARQGSGIVHQGVALLADQLATPALLDALQRPGPILVLDQISDPRNIGALMRTAQAFGASMVIAQERNAPEETGALAKVASGALELIPLLRIVNISRALIVLKSAGVWVVGLDGAAPGKLDGASFGERRVALVLGSEGEGMRRLTRETCDEIAGLSMPGGMESLNVSAAGAVALYELTRRF